MKIGFIGCGRMAQALIRGMLRSGMLPEDIVATDHHLAAVHAFVEETRICFRSHIGEVVSEVETVFLCVKPLDVEEALAPLGALEKRGLLVSIVAGLGLDRLASLLPVGWTAIRIMPNIAAELNASATSIVFPESLPDEQRQSLRDLVARVGIVLEISEKVMDAATAVGGSAPAYVYMVIEAIIEGGLKNGLDRKTATQLAAQAAVGCGQMIIAGSGHPALLRESVTSPGGTTAAGLATLELHGVRGAMIEAIDATVVRAKELQ